MQSLRSSIFCLWWHMYAWLFLHCAYGEGMQVHYGHIWNCCCTKKMTNQEVSLPVAFRHRSSLHILTNLMDTLQITTKFTDFTVGLMQSLRSSIFCLWWHMYAWLFLHCAYGEGMQVHYGHIWNCCCTKKMTNQEVSLPVAFRHRSSLHILTNLMDTLQTSAKSLSSLIFRRSLTKKRKGEFRTLLMCT